MQQHYLPKTFLKHFCDPQRPGQLWLYRRGRGPVVVSIGNVAKERDIYTFRTPDGQPDQQVELALSRMESRVTPILDRLNGPLDEITLTLRERVVLAWFTAFLLFRTRAMRRAFMEQTIRQVGDALESLGVNFAADEAFRDPTLEKLAMIEALSCTDNLAHKLATLGVEVLRSSECHFILPDRPISQVLPPENVVIPGFFELYMPVGSHTSVVWSTLHQPSDRPNRRNFAQANVVACNAHSLRTAVEFFVSSARDSELATSFSNTPVPVLVKVEDVGL